jgi:hypothetical protein
MPAHHPSTSTGRVLGRLERAWDIFRASYAGLSPAALTEPRTIGDWSVKDVLAHVTTWEQEALRYLPLIAAGGRPPRYASQGGIDAFNARTTEARRALSLAEVLGELDDTHGRLVALVEHAPAALLEGTARYRRRLRLDAHGHYPQHASAIRQWREQRGL